MADTPELAIGIQSCYDIVEKDLEVLDILKQNLMIDYSVSFYSDKITGRPARLGIKTPPAEQLEKIKEWLNEKNND